MPANDEGITQAIRSWCTAFWDLGGIGSEHRPPEPPPYQYKVTGQDAELVCGCTGSNIQLNCISYSSCGDEEFNFEDYQCCSDGPADVNEGRYPCHKDTEQCCQGRCIPVDMQCCSADTQCSTGEKCCGNRCVAEDSPCCQDNDKDGYGNEIACDDPSGDIGCVPNCDDCYDNTATDPDNCPTNKEDCDESTATCANCINPDSEEYCSGYDNDCDSYVDETFISCESSCNPCCDDADICCGEECEISGSTSAAGTPVGIMEVGQTGSTKKTTPCNNPLIISGNYIGVLYRPLGTQQFTINKFPDPQNCKMGIIVGNHIKDFQEAEKSSSNLYVVDDYTHFNSLKFSFGDDENNLPTPTSTKTIPYSLTPEISDDDLPRKKDFWMKAEDTGTVGSNNLNKISRKKLVSATLCPETKPQITAHFHSDIDLVFFERKDQGTKIYNKDSFQEKDHLSESKDLGVDLQLTLDEIKYKPPVELCGMPQIIHIKLTLEGVWYDKPFGYDVPLFKQLRGKGLNLLQKLFGEYLEGQKIDDFVIGDKDIALDPPGIDDSYFVKEDINIKMQASIHRFTKKAIVSTIIENSAQLTSLVYPDHPDGKKNLPEGGPKKSTILVNVELSKVKNLLAKLDSYLGSSAIDIEGSMNDIIDKMNKPIIVKVKSDSHQDRFNNYGNQKTFTLYLHSDFYPSETVANPEEMASYYYKGGWSGWDPLTIETKEVVDKEWKVTFSDAEMAKANGKEISIEYSAKEVNQYIEVTPSNVVKEGIQALSSLLDHYKHCCMKKDDSAARQQTISRTPYSRTIGGKDSIYMLRESTFFTLEGTGYQLSFGQEALKDVFKTFSFNENAFFEIENVEVYRYEDEYFSDMCSIEILETNSETIGSSPMVVESIDGQLSIDFEENTFPTDTIVTINKISISCGETIDPDGNGIVDIQELFQLIPLWWDRGTGLSYILTGIEEWLNH